LDIPQLAGRQAPTQGKNILSGLMNAWSEGYVALCIYTFYDQGDGFGVLNGPGNPKLSGTYIHNTGATAKTFTTGSLTYALNGLPSTGKSLLFQKSNGHYELIIWNNVTNWNSSAVRQLQLGQRMSPSSLERRRRRLIPTIQLLAARQ
jgi:serralysin